MGRSLLVTLLLALTLGSLRAQEAARPRTPLVPWEMSEPERKALAQGALLLSQGRFEQAASLIKPFILPTVVRVHADWTTAPKLNQADFRRVAQQAVKTWNAALAGVTRFQWTGRKEEAEVRIVFARTVAVLRSGEPQLGCLDGMLNRPPLTIKGQGPRRSMRLRIALDEPYAQRAHDAASIGRHVAQGLGLYLGLTLTENEDSLMADDVHGPGLDISPTETERNRARQYQQVRARLLQFAQKRVAVQMPKPTLVVEKTEMDAGEISKGVAAHYTFKYRNTGDAPLHIEARSNCGCAVARYDPVLQPGQEGTLEADVKTDTFRGRIVKTVSVKSDDPARPVVLLRLIASVRSIAQVLPSETPVVFLKDRGPTEQALEIRLRRESPPVEITRVACGAPYVTAKTELIGETADSRVHRLTLTIGENAPIGRAVLPVTVFTSSPREPQIAIYVSCEKGILAVPFSLYMGAISSRTTLPLSQTVMLLKRDGAFHIQKIDTDDPRLAVRQETVQDGAQYRLTVTYRGGWTTGSILSRVTVTTDDPRQPKVVIPVMANVFSDREGRR